MLKKKATRLSRFEERLAQVGARARPGLTPARQALLLRQGVAILAEEAKTTRAHPMSLAEQPFDSQLLRLSRLYRQNRKIYVEGGGVFRATLVSSPRTLSSSILLEQMIEYSPIEREFVWAAQDPKQAKDSSHLLHLRTYVSSLFHEQSHRILWRMLPPPPKDATGLRRYLNFVESLVITLDMALGDELGALALILYLTGAIYDPGTRVREGLSRRQYRNYLQAALLATYLTLELYSPEQISQVIQALFPAEGELAERAAKRSGNLDPGFVNRTNPVWQKKQRENILRALRKLPGESLCLSENPLDARLQYLFGERWFELFGL